jgi:hypothetical protein
MRVAGCDAEEPFLCRGPAATLPRASNLVGVPSLGGEPPPFERRGVGLASIPLRFLEWPKPGFTGVGGVHLVGATVCAGRSGVWRNSREDFVGWL